LSNSDNISQGSLIQRVTRGFTIIELLVVIAIIGVLSTIGVVSFSSIQSNARNTQRSSKVTILSEALEKYYDKNGEYPSCAAMTADSNTVTTTTLKGLDPDVLTSPTGTKGTNSISCIDSPSPDSFAYVGGLTQYTLKYKEEDSSTVPILDSRRHVIGATYTLTLVAGTGGTVNAGGTYGANTTQTITATASTYYSFSSWSGSTGCSGGKDSSVLLDADKSCTANFTPTTIAVPSTPTVTPSTAGATTTWSWGAASCPGNTARYQYRYTNTSGYNSGLIATASTSVAFTTSTEGRTYTVTAQAECYNGVTASGMSATGSASYTRPVTTYWGCTDPAANNYNSGANANDGSCTYPIAVPTTPVVTANTAGATTTFSWGAASCPGNTARYQYRYTNTSGYNSGLIATASTSVAFTTSTEGRTYTVTAQAECYNGVTASGMSATGSASYTRPVTTYWGCTDPAANNYNSGANANDGSCTYPPVTYTLTLNYTGSGSVSGGGTYNAGSTPTISASPSTYYYFNGWSGSTGCSGGASHTITMDANKTCTAALPVSPISPPATPTVTANTAGGTTTWSWGAASCPGNSARYQYRYTNTSGYDSGLVATASTSVAFTTSTEGRTYTVTAQAECYNGVTASGMSATGSASYYRLITYQLSGSVGNASLGSTSGFGGYTEGTVATLSATPNAGSHIYQPWSGSTGCSGAAIHTITMDSYKSCSVSYMTDWIPGLSSTVLSGKYVYYINLGTFYQFYPAQTACSAIGGRVPNLQELQSISANRSAYGDNFTPDNTWSSTEYNSTYGYQVLFWDGSTYYVDKTLYYLAVRCVKG